MSDEACRIERNAETFVRLLGERQTRRVPLAGTAVGGYTALYFVWQLNDEELYLLSSRVYAARE